MLMPEAIFIVLLLQSTLQFVFQMPENIYKLFFALEEISLTIHSVCNLTVAAEYVHLNKMSIVLADFKHFTANKQKYFFTFFSRETFHTKFHPNRKPSKKVSMESSRGELKIPCKLDFSYSKHVHCWNFCYEFWHKSGNNELAMDSLCCEPLKVGVESKRNNENLIEDSSVEEEKRGKKHELQCRQLQNSALYVKHGRRCTITTWNCLGTISFAGDKNHNGRIKADSERET